MRVYKNNAQVRPDTVPPADDYFYIENDYNAYFYIDLHYMYGSNPPASLEISYDKNSRSDYTLWNALRLLPWERVYWRNKSTTQTQFSSFGEYYSFELLSPGTWPQVKVWWDVNYLLCKNSTTDLTASWSYCFYRLFADFPITSVPSLPATTLTEWCYYSMFDDCGRITTPPILPATTLSEHCYAYMFYQCTSLTSAPQLPATTMVEECYNSMFAWCTSLTSAPNLPATTLAKWCYWNMFSRCTSLTSAPSLPVTTLADECYIGMFSWCSSLTSAPQLPATTLVDSCYVQMFAQCSSLTTPPSIPATTTGVMCCFGMFANCTGLASIPALYSLTLEYWCYEDMFYGCTNIKLSETQTWEYQTPYRIPITWTWVDDFSTSGTFSNTWWTFASSPSVNTTYYTSNTIIS